MNSASKKLPLAEDELNNRVAVVMGSDSDLITMKPAVEILENLGASVETRILSAHRTPIEMFEFAEKAKDNGFKVIIAGAGGAAHLPGMIASLCNLPVIGVPVQSKAMSGIDSLHSIVQMPAGIPVATVAIGGGLNAGILAAQILALSNQLIEKNLSLYKENLHNTITKKDKLLKELGASKYLKTKN